MNPAPRSYPPSVTLLRRADRGPSAACAATSIEEVEAWLLSDAIASADSLELIESTFWRLMAAGLGLDRASLHVGTLHPQLYGFAWVWNRDDGLCDEVKVAEAVLKSAAYRLNPLAQVIESGVPCRIDITDPEQRARYPLVEELAELGFTDYAVLPLRAGGAYHNAATVATRQPGGFSPEQMTSLERLLRVFALHVERHIMTRIAGNIVDTYLGPSAGGQVLSGTIRRGDGQSVRAVIWVSDLRGFTDLADRLTAPEMIVVLNAYFERMAGAVIQHGGDVLKFIGDGVLAMFPFDSFPSEADAATAALAAARTALATTAAMCETAPPALAAIGGWNPLRSGIALHEGEIFFGNVGAPLRLDFTVIGPAVNATSRIEALCKPLRRSILISGPVAARLTCPLVSVGVHSLRGVATPLELFTPED